MHMNFHDRKIDKIYEPEASKTLLRKSALLPGNESHHVRYQINLRALEFRV